MDGLARANRRGCFFLTCGAALVTWLAAVQVAPADDAAAMQSVAERLETVLKAVPARTRVALVVADARTGRRWYEAGPHTPLKPASVQKLFVTAAALERLGPQFQLQTRVFLHDGELLVLGGGDPGLGDERLAKRAGRDVNHFFDEIAAGLRAQGVDTLQKIVLDDSIFDQVGRNGDWPPDQGDTWYQAPVGGLNYNDNCVDVSIRVRGRTPEIVLQPPLPAEFVQDELRIGKRNSVQVRRPADSDIIELRGTIARAYGPAAGSVGRPTTFFGHALRYGLTERGINVRGEVVRRKLTPADESRAAPIAAHATALPDILWRCNTFSQNLFAECLTKALAAYEPDGRRRDMPGSWEGGTAIVREVLARLGVDTDGLVLRDGSGLSHRNQATADQFVQLLAVMQRHRQADVFRASLAQPGEEGSMRRRFDDPALRGRLVAKTGTLANVHTLAGYLTRPDGTLLAFALLINGDGGANLPLQVCKILAGD